jgi:hypothetical protein
LLLVVLWLLFLSGSERRRPDQKAKDRSSFFSWKLAMCRGSGTRCFVNLVEEEEEEEEVGIQCNFLCSKNWKKWNHTYNILVFGQTFVNFLTF